MAIYVQLQEKDIQTIARVYDLTVYQSTPIEAGAMNSNFLLDTEQGRYILTVFDTDTARLAIELGQLLLMLAAYRFPTSRLVRPVKGGLHTVYAGSPVIIKHYIIGQVVPTLNPNMVHQIGVTLARLHQVPAPDFLSGKLPYGVDCYANVINQGIDPDYERWLAARLPELEQQLPKDLPRGLVHGDLFTDNVLFADGQLQAIIDFESAIHHAWVFDLAMAIVGLCGDLNADRGKVRALLTGYEQVRRLGVSEKEALPVFIEYVATTVSCWRFWQYHINKQIPAKAATHWQMVNIAEAVRSIPKAQFLKTVFA